MYSRSQDKFGNIWFHSRKTKGVNMILTGRDKQHHVLHFNIQDTREIITTKQKRGKK